MSLRIKVVLAKYKDQLLWIWILHCNTMWSCYYVLGMDQCPPTVVSTIRISLDLNLNGYKSIYTKEIN